MPRLPRKSLPTVSDCAGCGICCMHMGYPEYVQATEHRPAEEHWESMPVELKEELLAHVAGYQKPEGELDGPCFWFDEELRRCRHHEHRPRVCRDFQVASDDCLAWRECYHDRILADK